MATKPNPLATLRMLAVKAPIANDVHATVAELVERKADAHFAWQMLSAICDTDPSADRIKAKDAAARVWAALAAFEVSP